MHIQERLIVPGLGVVILLSVFILDVLLVYKLLLAPQAREEEQVMTCDECGCS